MSPLAEIKVKADSSLNTKKNKRQNTDDLNSSSDVDHTINRSVEGTVNSSAPVNSSINSPRNLRSSKKLPRPAQVVDTSLKQKSNIMNSALNSHSENIIEQTDDSVSNLSYESRNLRSAKKLQKTHQIAVSKTKQKSDKTEATLCNRNDDTSEQSEENGRNIKSESHNLRSSRKAGNRMAVEKSDKAVTSPQRENSGPTEKGLYEKSESNLEKSVNEVKKKTSHISIPVISPLKMKTSGLNSMQSSIILHSTSEDDNESPYLPSTKLQNIESTISAKRPKQIDEDEQRGENNNRNQLNQRHMKIERKSMHRYNDKNSVLDTVSSFVEKEVNRDRFCENSQQQSGEHLSPHLKLRQIDKNRTASTNPEKTSKDKDNDSAISGPQLSDTGEKFSSQQSSNSLFSSVNVSHSSRDDDSAGQSHSGDLSGSESHQKYDDDVMNNNNDMSNDDDVISNDDDVMNNNNVVMSNDDVVMSNDDVVMSNDDVVMSNDDVLMSNDDVVMSNDENHVVHAQGKRLRVTSDTELNERKTASPKRQKFSSDAQASRSASSLMKKMSSSDFPGKENRKKQPSTVDNDQSVGLENSVMEVSNNGNVEKQATSKLPVRFTAIEPQTSTKPQTSTEPQTLRRKKLERGEAHFVTMWCGGLHQRYSKDIMDLDVVLDCVSESLSKERENCETIAEKKAVKKLMMYMKKEITQTIDKVESVKTVGVGMKTSKSNLKGLRKQLINTEKVKTRLVDEISQKKKQLNENLHSISKWMCGFETLLKSNGKLITKMPQNQKLLTCGYFPVDA